MRLKPGLEGKSLSIVLFFNAIAQINGNSRITQGKNGKGR
jgi:hypothetical protein